MKILHLLNTNTFSGAENVVCTIIKNREKKHEMIYCSPDGPIKEKLFKEHIEFLPIKKLSYTEVKKAIKLFKPDIIHAHDNRATIIASLFSKKIKIISHIHGNNRIMNNLNIKSALFNFCSKRINKFIWVSDSSLNDYYFNQNLKNKSIVLYNVIDSNEIILKSKQYTINENFDLIYLGRIGYPKNPEKLIEVIKLIKKQKNNIKVAIVGDGEEREKIEELINNYNLRKNIKMYGFQSNPYPILNSSKIMIMTSIYEGTPMSALEAQLFGKPIISTPVDGLKKIIINDYNGYLTDNTNEMAIKICEWLNNSKIYKKLSINSFNQFNSFMNIEKYMNIISKLYNNGD